MPISFMLINAYGIKSFKEGTSYFKVLLLGGGICEILSSLVADIRCKALSVLCAFLHLCMHCHRQKSAADGGKGVNEPLVSYSI